MKTIKQGALTVRILETEEEREQARAASAAAEARSRASTDPWVHARWVEADRARKAVRP